MIWEWEKVHWPVDFTMCIPPNRIWMCVTSILPHSNPAWMPPGKFPPQLGVEPQRSFQRQMESIERKMADAYTAKRNVVILLDDAQLMDPSALEVIHRLYNFDYDAKVAQVLAFGQNEIDRSVRNQQSSQRAGVCPVDPFTAGAGQRFANGAVPLECGRPQRAAHS